MTMEFLILTLDYNISNTYRGSLDIFKDDVGAGDVDHVQAATDDQTPFMEVVSVSLFECGLESRVLRYKLSSSPPS